MRSVRMMVVALLLLAGTACESAQSVFVDGVKAGYIESGIHKEYKAYIDADPDLSGETKVIRKETADKLKQLIEENEEGE